MIECSVCHSRIESPVTKSIYKAYDKHRNIVSSKTRFLNVLLVSGDCILVGFQVDGGFKYSPVSVNFLTEVTKVVFAIIMLLFQARHRKVGEKSLLSISALVQAGRNNVLLAVPALLYAVNNYLKFTMQLYFNPATVKMLSNLKVLVIAILLKIVMKRRFSILQWEALALLLIGISINQLRSLPEGATSVGLPLATGAYFYTLIFVTVPSMASVFNEYALKSQFDSSIYHQNLFLYGYCAMFNFLAILGMAIFKGPGSLDILQGHSKATMLLICNNAAQGILSSFFFKYADTILKKYSSTIATIFTGIASAVLFGHTLTVNFVLGISVVIISMHQFFSALSKVKDEEHSGKFERVNSLDSKSAYYSNVAKELSSQLQQQQDWVKSQKVRRQMEEHDLVNNKLDEKMTESEGNLSVGNCLIPNNENNEVNDLIVKLDSEKGKLDEILQLKAKLVRDNDKLKDSIEQAKRGANHLKPELLEISITTLEEEYKALLSDKDGETQYLCSLKDQVEQIKGISQVINCACGKEYMLDLRT